MRKLTEAEGRIVAIALQGLAMRHGPSIFADCEEIGHALDISDYLVEYLSSWIKYSANLPPHSANGDSDHAQQPPR